MRRFWLVVLLGMILAPGWAAALTMPPGAPVGAVTRIRGEASAELAGSTRMLAQDAAIEMGDRLKTGPGARLEVRFLDGTTLTLGEKADFTIDELSVGDAKGTELFTRVSGAIRLLGGSIARMADHKVEIAGNAGTIGIRGTEVWGGTIKPGSLLDVFLIEGAVEVRSPGGTVVLDKPGLGTSITAPGGAPETPDQWRPALRDRALATVSFEAP